MNQPAIQPHNETTRILHPSSPVPPKEYMRQSLLVKASKQTNLSQSAACWSAIHSPPIRLREWHTPWSGLFNFRSLKCCLTKIPE